MKKDPLIYIAHILENIAAIQAFVADLDQDADSGASRPAIPREVGHRFQSKPAAL
ncbi:MAG: hypothetical protein ACOZHQ_16140 [Thermodesulfobacteriota bacterium]